MNSTTPVFESMISVRRVPSTAGLQTLPKHFGKYTLTVESAVYSFAHRLCSDYDGGYWHMNELGDGGFYMAPESVSMNLHVEGNGFGGELSADAAGIVFSLFACSHLSFTFSDPTFTQHCHWLRDFACEHPERSLIIAAID